MIRRPYVATAITPDRRHSDRTSGARRAEPVRPRRGRRVQPAGHPDRLRARQLRHHHGCTGSISRAGNHLPRPAPPPWRHPPATADQCARGRGRLGRRPDRRLASRSLADFGTKIIRLTEVAGLLYDRGLPAATSSRSSVATSQTYRPAPSRNSRAWLTPPRPYDALRAGQQTTGGCATPYQQAGDHPARSG
jgi:hypothetical protein